MQDLPEVRESPELTDEEVIVAEAHVLAGRLVEWFRQRVLSAEAGRDAALAGREDAEDDRRQAEDARTSAVGDRVAAEDDRRQAEDERAQTQVHVIEVERLLAASEELAERLQHALDSRIIIEQAKGDLAARHGVTPEAAFEAMRGHARSRNTPIREVSAKALTGSLDLDI